MSIIYILIPIAMIFVILAFVIFFWAVKNDQFEDLERHGTSILFDEPTSKENSKESNSPQNNTTINKD